MQKTNQTAIIVTDRRVMPPWGGNSLRILGLIRSLRVLGWRVVIISANVEGVNQLRKEVDTLVLVRASTYLGGNMDTFNVEPFRRAVELVAEEVRPAVVVAEYAWLSPVLQSLPKDVERWVDCHDVFHERTSRFRALGLDPWVVCNREQESEYLGFADTLIAIQNREARLLKELCPAKRVVCLLPSIELPHGFKRTQGETFKVLTVGAKHAGNEGIRQFAGSPWASVLTRIPEAHLQIVGAIGSRMAPRRSVEIIGEVNDLYPYYSSAAVVVCPMTVGTGIKIKMLEALRFGKAVVATRAAMEGLPVSQSHAWLTVDTLSECADAVATLLTDCKARSNLEDAAFSYGKKYLSQARFLKVIRSILPNASA